VFCSRRFLLLRGDRSLSVNLGFLFSTFIFLKKFVIFFMFVFILCANTWLYVISRAPYMFSLVLLNAGHSHSMCWAVSIGSLSSFCVGSVEQYVQFCVYEIPMLYKCWFRQLWPDRTFTSVLIDDILSFVIAFDILSKL